MALHFNFSFHASKKKQKSRKTVVTWGKNDTPQRGPRSGEDGELQGVVSFVDDVLAAVLTSI